MASNLTIKQRYWIEHLTAAEKAATPLSTYAKQHQLDLKALYNWKSLLKKKGITPQAAPSSDFVEVVPVSVPDNTNITIKLPNNIRIDVDGKSHALSVIIRELITL